jgi:mannitol-specific phosphotransferase system IIBC component
MKKRLLSYLMHILMPVLPLVVFLSCYRHGEVPVEGISKVQVGGYVLDLTFGPLATAIAVPLIVWMVTFFVKRAILKADADKEKKKQEELEEKRKLAEEKRKKEEERHLAVMDEIGKTNKTMREFCDVFYQHGHTIKNNGGQLETGDIIIKRKNAAGGL